MSTTPLVVRSLAVCISLSACVGDSTVAEQETPAAPVPLPSGPYVARAGGGLPGASYVWTDRSEVFVPRMLPTSVDQPARNRLLVYGGWQENGVRFDTWEWDGLGWIRRRPLHDPGSRVGATTTYDEARQRVILNGGATDFVPDFVFEKQSSTWEWDGNDWTQLSVLHTPPPLAGAASAWDAVNQRVLLFGGFRPPGSAGAQPTEAPGSDEMWAFDGFDWQQIPRSEPWPPANGFASMAWDRERKRAVLLTGYPSLTFKDGAPTFGTSPDGAPNFSPIGDTWEWDGATWTPTGTQRGNAIVTAGGTLFYDEVKKAVGMQLTELDIVGREVKQAYRDYGDGITWPLVAFGPRTSMRILVNGRWSTANQAPFSFGGILLEPDTFRVLTEMALDEGVMTNPWIMQPTPVQMPAVHHGSYVTEDDGTSTLFGGTVGTTFTDDMYSWNGGKWVPVVLPEGGEAPPARARGAMSRFGQAALLYGGEGEGGNLNDTWTWNHAAKDWRLIEDAGGPSARRSGTLFEVGSAAYLYGGIGTSNELSYETWRFRDGVWAMVSVPSPPSLREAPCSASLPGKAKALLAGGTDNADVWSFDGDWTQDNPGTGMGIREGCAMAYGTSFGQMLLVSGSGAPGTQDIWSLTPTVQGVIGAINSEARGELPPRRSGAVLVDNPRSGGLVMFGGVRNDTDAPLADTWQLKVLGQSCADGTSCGNGAFCTEGVCCESVSCGPCGTCAVGGLCAPRPAGPAPGCDGNYACNDSGHCRLGTGGACADNDACAGGACIKTDAGAAGVCCGTEGCAVACVGDQLRNAQGELTACAPYGCQGVSCKSSCTSVLDCTGGAICNEGGKCVPPVAADAEDTSSCGCKVAGASSGTFGWGALGALALLAGRRARRFSSRAGAA